MGRVPWPKNIRVVKWRMFTSLISNLHNCRVKNSASVRQLCGLTMKVELDPREGQHWDLASWPSSVTKALTKKFKLKK